MKSKNLAFLLLVGLIAPSAVMSVESFNTVTQDLEGMNSKKRTALKEKTINLQRSIQCKRNNPYPSNGPHDFLLKNGIIPSVLDGVVDLLDRLAPENLLKYSTDLKSVFKNYYDALTKIEPDSWGDYTLEHFNSDSFNAFFKAMVVVNTGKEAFASVPIPDSLRVLEKMNYGKEWRRETQRCLNFKMAIESIKTPDDVGFDDFNHIIKEMPSSTESVKKIIEFKPIFEKFKEEEVDPIMKQARDLINYNVFSVDNAQSDKNTNSVDITPEKMQRHLTKSRQLTAEYCPDSKEGNEIDDQNYNETQKLIKECCSQKNPLLVAFFKAESRYEKRRNQELKKQNKILQHLLFASKSNPKELALTQKRILDSIEIILDYIENSSTKDPKRDQKEEEKKTE